MFFVIDFVRRKLAEREPFDPAWREILERRIPFYKKLRGAERERFETKLKIFLRTKSFEGAGGFTMTEEARVVIAASAARLIMNIPGEHYQRLHEIVVYPSHYRHTRRNEVDPSASTRPPNDGPHVILGEAFGPGVVVLSYDAVLGGIANPRDGHDTALHEFAHVLDGSDGAFDGTPDLPTLDAYGPWARTMTRAFTSLRSRVGRRGRRLLRDYAATNEAEFFAVATETFFEKPAEMYREQPELYDVLAKFYRTDPIRRGSRG